MALLATKKTKESTPSIAEGIPEDFVQIKLLSSLMDDPVVREAQAASMSWVQREQARAARFDELTHGRTRPLTNLRDRLELDDEAKAIAEGKARTKVALDAAYDAALNRLRPALRRELDLRLAKMAEAVDALREAASSVAEVEAIAERFAVPGGNFAPARTPLRSTIGGQTVGTCDKLKWQLKFARGGA